MRTPILLLFFGLFTLQLTAQTFEIPAEKYPFSRVFDWTGEGMLLLNEDPTHLTNQKFLTFVGDEQRTLWQETFVPKAQDPIFLASSGTRYVYYMDQIELDFGKFTVYQLNNAGNLKTKTCNYTVAMKKLGYDVNSLELVDVQVTDQVLVHIFETFDKETKSNVLIGGFMTHNNFLTYAAEIGRWVEEENRIVYAGWTGDEIAFYQNCIRDKKKGIECWTMSAKGEKKGAQFVETPPVIAPILLKETGTCGADYLKTKMHPVECVVSYQGGTWQLASDDNGLVLRVLENKIWVKKTHLNNVPKGKKGYELSVYRMQEGMLFSVADRACFLSNSINHSSKVYSTTAVFNPSKSLTDLSPGQLVFAAKTHYMIMDPTKLGQAGSLSLELKNK